MTTIWFLYSQIHLVSILGNLILLTYINWHTRLDFYPTEEVRWVYVNATAPEQAVSA